MVSVQHMCHYQVCLSEDSACAHRKKAVVQQKQDIFDPLWSTSRQHDYRMAAMWATLRQLRLACTGLLAHLDQLNARWAQFCSHVQPISSP